MQRLAKHEHLLPPFLANPWYHSCFACWPACCWPPRRPGPADSVPAGLLYGHARAWLRQHGYTLAEADSAAGRLVAAHAFGVYDRGYVTRHLHGQVRYRLTVEVKQGRYRAQFTDFRFAYYQDDRSAHPQPTGKTKPLEDATAPGWQKLWESHRRDTALAVGALAAELKTAMLARPPTTTAPVPRGADW